MASPAKVVGGGAAGDKKIDLSDALAANKGIPVRAPGGDEQEDDDDSGDDQRSSSEDDKSDRPSKKKKVDSAVVDLLNSDDEADQARNGEGDGGDSELDFESVNEWEGPFGGEVIEEVLHAVVRACPFGARNMRGPNHSSEHVQVVAIYRTKDEATARADEIKARLDPGAKFGDGFIPDSNEDDSDEIDVWTQPVFMSRRI